MNSPVEQIQAVWAVEQEILDVVDKVCQENSLRYSLAYGTLLGAVRHGGFIPWDDDIDLILPRADYNEFIRIFNEAPPEGYLLINKTNSKDYTNNFTKIVKDHTTFLQHEQDAGKDFHKGIFVDLFPADRIAPSKLGRMTQYIACAVNLLYSRGYTSGTGGIIGLTERCLLKLPKKWHRSLRNGAEKYMCKWNNRTDSAFIVPCTIRGCKHYFPGNSFDKLTTILFNGKPYSAFENYDQVLRTSYGDYMQLPSEKDRVWHHHPILIDFDHNYEELQND